MEIKSKVVALILVGKKSATAWYVSSDVKSLAICRVVYAIHFLSFLWGCDMNTPHYLQTVVIKIDDAVSYDSWRWEDGSPKRANK